MPERKWFESWFIKAFKGKEALLAKDKEGVYKDETINAMFIGFAGAWSCK